MQLSSPRWFVRVAVATLITSTPALPSEAQTAAPHRAIVLFERGEYGAAKAALSNGEPLGALSAYYLGRIAVIEDRAADAVALLERAVKADDDKADYHLWLGIALGLQARDAGKFRQAMLGSRAKGEFERAVALDPRNVGAHEGLVRFYSIAPGIAGGSMRRAREHASMIATVSRMRGHLANGMILEREKDLIAAEREYRAAVAATPDSAPPLLMLGALYQRMERWDDAFDAYARVLAMSGAEVPERLSAEYQFGRTGALSGKRLADSEAALKRWMDRAPAGTSPRRVARTRARLGMVYARQGRTDLARSEFEAALRLNPKDADARDGLARLGR